jgi:hypothetical protein
MMYPFQHPEMDNVCVSRFGSDRPIISRLGDQSHALKQMWNLLLIIREEKLKEMKILGERFRIIPLS